MPQSKPLTTALPLTPAHENAKKFIAGLTAFQHGQLAQAKSILEDLLKDEPNYFDALHLCGIVLRQLQETKRSIAFLEKALVINSDHADLHSNLGNALTDDAQYEQAVTHCNMAIRLNPRHTNAHSNRAIALQRLGKLDEALKSFAAAIHIKPDDAKAHFNRGNALTELKQLEAAVASYDRAINLKSDYAQAHANRGVALTSLGQLDAALTSCEKAIAIQPNDAQAIANCGLVQQELRQLGAAFASYEKAISLKPDLADAHWNKSLALLLCGEFETGWKLYEWRWRNGGLGFKIPNFSQPLWLGVESLKGRTILLHSEQGFGDTIQFCRYAKLVKALGARVVMQVPRALLTLLQSLDGVDELVAKGQALPAFDYHCPLMSLPLAFKTTLSTAPSPEPYLRSDSAKVAQWHARLGPKTKPRIGLVWSGSTGHKNDHNRSLELDALAPYLPEGLAYVCLQNEIREVDKLALQQSTIQHFSDELKDFADTAALCELMDVVISVDTSVAHLSGALGKPTWILLPHNSDWRWLLDREDSPWYDSVRLFRQDKSWSWSTVLQKVTKALLKSRPTHISSERRS